MLSRLGWILANLVLLNVVFVGMIALIATWRHAMRPRLERRRARRRAIKRLIGGAAPAPTRPRVSVQDADLLRRSVRIIGRSGALRTRLSGPHWPLSA